MANTKLLICKITCYGLTHHIVAIYAANRNTDLANSIINFFKEIFIYSVLP